MHFCEYNVGTHSWYNIGNELKKMFILQQHNLLKNYVFETMFFFMVMDVFSICICLFKSDLIFDI